MLEGEWSPLSEMYNNEESNFLPQLMTNSFLPTDHFSACPDFGHALNSWQAGYESSTMDMGYGYGEGLLHFSDTSNSNYYFSRGSGYESCYYPQVLAMNADESITNFFSGSEEITGVSMQTSEGDNVVEGVDCLMNKAMIDDCNVVEESNKKRSLSSKVPKNKRNVKPRKNLKQLSPENNSNHEDEEEEEENNARTIKRQGSSSCSSEENSMVASQELKTKALNSSGKTRASRGSATDPQSLYARKRRERINERLRILQSLVPNGTKVDISTMLEEAVQYVNFLKLQIKLLSSDDLWMYAPLAYNGMDIGLDLKINMINELKRG